MRCIFFALACQQGQAWLILAGNMKSPSDLFESNRLWASETEKSEPGFFERLAEGQAPKYLWIGCADSRVPAAQVMGLKPGEVFVHRNIANVVVQTDLNLLSVLQYAVEVLKVEHIILCGHYGCGGVKAAYENQSFGLIDNWLRHIQVVKARHADELDSIPEDQRFARMCELNVMAQAENLAKTTVVQGAWGRGQKLDIHSWIFQLDSGLLKNVQEPLRAG